MWKSIAAQKKYEIDQISNDDIILFHLHVSSHLLEITLTKQKEQIYRNILFVIPFVVEISRKKYREKNIKNQLRSHLFRYQPAIQPTRFIEAEL